jgi:dTDP-glucose 4,6-dehydratase
MTMAYHRAHGLDTRIVRIFNTYGPRMRPHDGRVVSNFIAQALTGEPLTIYGDGSQTRSFCYVEDEVEGIYRLYMHGDANPTNIGNPDEFTVRELAEIVLELTGSDSEIVYHDLPADDPKVRRPDITRARQTLDWEPKVTLREGVARTIEYFRELLKSGRIQARALGSTVGRSA